MERRMNALACAALLLSCMLGFASVIDAYHGHAFASHPRRSTDPSTQAACMKNLLLQSDFYPTPSIAVTSSMWIRTLSTKTLAADNPHSWFGAFSLRNQVLFRIYNGIAALDLGDHQVQNSQMDGGYLVAPTRAHPLNTGQPGFQMDDWIHYTYTRDADKINGTGRVYINGELYQNQSNTASLKDFVMTDGIDASRDTYFCFGTYVQDIGGINDSASPSMAIDDFYYMNREISDAEALALYQNSRYLGGDASVLIYYDFDTFTGVNNREIVNLGSLGARYNIDNGGVWPRAGETRVKAYSIDADVDLAPMSLVVSQNIRVTDMGPPGGFGLMAVVPSGTSKIDGIIGDIRIDTLPAFGVLKTAAGATITAGSTHTKDDVYITIDWSTLTTGSAIGRDVKALDFLITYNSVQSILTVRDGSVAPIPMMESATGIEDFVKTFAPIYREPNYLKYSSKVESFATGLTATDYEGTVVPVGGVVTNQLKKLRVTPPADHQGLLQDAMCFSATNEMGLSTATSCVNLTMIPFNDLPVLTAYNASIINNNSRNMTIDFSTLVKDMDNDVTSIVIAKMPTKGKLYYHDGEQIAHEFRLDAMQPVYEQYVTQVLNVSTHYAFSDPNYRWSVAQIMGIRDEFIYGDSPQSWCPYTKLGTGIHADRTYTSVLANGTAYYYGPWDADTAFTKYGFTEYVEVKYDTPVYPSTIEIGMPRGMGAVTKVWAESVNGQSRMTGTSGPDRKWVLLWETKADKGIQTDAATFQQYYIYNEPTCALGEKVDTLRLELDTRTADDWNEVDYMYLYGSDKLPVGVIPYRNQAIYYVPDEYAWGDDTIEFNAYDCGYKKYSKQAVNEKIQLSVTPQISTTMTTSVRLSQSRTTGAATPITLLPTKIDPQPTNPNRVLTITQIPAVIGNFDIVTDYGAAVTSVPFVLASTTSSLTVKAYSCDRFTSNLIGFEYADTATGNKIYGAVDILIDCLTDLAVPCSSTHLQYTVGACSSENERVGTYSFTSGTTFAPSSLCCNPLNEDARVCPSGQTLPPSFVVECDYVKETSSIASAFFGVCLTFMLLFVSFILFVIIKIGAYKMRGHAPLIVTCNIGGIIGVLGCLLYAGEWTTDKCRLIAALPSQAFTIVFASIVLKAWRIDATFNNKSLMAAKIGLGQVFGRFLIINLFDLTLLLLFLFVNDVRQTTHYKQVDGRDIVYSVCTSDGVYMGYILLLTKFCLLFYGVMLAVRVRKVKQDFSETQYMIYSIYSVAFIGLIGVYLYLFSEMDTEPAYEAYQICVLLVFTIPNVLMMTPRIKDLIQPPKIGDADSAGLGVGTLFKTGGGSSTMTGSGTTTTSGNVAVTAKTVSDVVSSDSK